MADKLVNIVGSIEQLSLIEVSELVKMLEEKLGVSAAMPTVAAPVASSSSAPAEEAKSEFDIVLKSAGDNKMNVIKEIRTITGLGLKEAKEASETAGKVLKSGVAKAEADKIKEQLEKAGAVVELK
ncbi:50S ribosomal protein L7/L12 [Candidatus Hydrogenosomobacter endosymbioticus]|uniref:Large ribosomal subunit protein bL12 n=1 Tax=Candidatus Hydrogenosomobacter endosymbioticus TaxID=2558174 RepID=A0ABM7V9S3_9PROT|nr:50S ribosomal protein L7/L12 [Candidatus Hydrogenosomobacter endosymbioticus]BDB96549.1 50S ribosomal protein L7/L12 [Candidatus Hydrogenosomobacter endosymbioticus]